MLILFLPLEYIQIFIHCIFKHMTNILQYEYIRIFIHERESYLLHTASNNLQRVDVMIQEDVFVMLKDILQMKMKISK